MSLRCQYRRMYVERQHGVATCHLSGRWRPAGAGTWLLPGLGSTPHVLLVLNGSHSPHCPALQIPVLGPVLPGPIFLRGRCGPHRPRQILNGRLESLPGCEPNPSSATYLLCDRGQVTGPRYASISHLPRRVQENSVSELGKCSGGSLALGRLAFPGGSRQHSVSAPR